MPWPRRGIREKTRRIGSSYLLRCGYPYRRRRSRGLVGLQQLARQIRPDSFGRTERPRQRLAVDQISRYRRVSYRGRRWCLALTSL